MTNRDEPVTNQNKSLRVDLEERVRARGVRVDERLALLRTMAEPSGPEELHRRIESLKQRMEAAASSVRGALR